MKKCKRIFAVLCAAVISAGIASVNIGTVVSVASESQDSISSYKDKISELDEKQAELDKQLNDTKDEIDKQQEYMKTLNEQIEVITETMTTIDVYIAEIEASINDLQVQIDDGEALVSQQKDALKVKTDQYLKRIRAIYIGGDTSYLKIILDAQSFYDLLMRAELFKRVTEYDSGIIDEISALADEYSANVSALKKNKAYMDSQIDEYTSQQQEWSSQLDKLNELYSQTDEAIQTLSEQEKSYLEQKDAIDAEQAEFEAELAKAIAEQNAAGSSDVDATGIFAWPVPGYYALTSGVGPRWGAYHKGIDISSYGIYGTSVVAADSGTVIRSCNTCTHDYGKYSSCGCGGGYGNYVMIDHGNGYITVYGHMCRINVSTGDTVSKGQTLGYVGTTGYSTGPHLHFEIRLNGNIEDPELYY